MTNELLIKDSGTLARAELDTMITTAKAYPRDTGRSIGYAVELATMDEATAQSCFYCLPRKDKQGKNVEIRGGSIRLAEIIAASWGNIHSATRIVENDGKHVTAEGVCWDLENNVKTARQVKVSIMFGGKDGKAAYTANADMQTMLSNAAASKALRNAIFSVVPKALVNIVLEKAMTFSVGDQKTVGAKVKEVIDKLNKMGITTETILGYYGHEVISAITADELRSLIGVGTAIKEGYIKPEQVFNIDDIEPGMTAMEKVQNLLADKKAKADNGELLE